MPESWYQGYEEVCDLILWEAVEDDTKEFTFYDLSTGSRTIDIGIDLTIEFEGGTFRVRKDWGTLSGYTLFHDFNYFPEEEVWSGSEERLESLLENLCRDRELDPDNLIPKIEEPLGKQFVEYRQKERETSDPEALAELRAEYRDLLSEVSVICLPWNRDGGDRCALKMSLGDEGWEGQYFEPSGNEPALEYDDMTESEDYGTLSDAWRDLRYDVPYDWDEFLQLLVESDPDWKKIILFSRWLDWKQTSGASS
ncbi:MAG: hypothetical protein SNJ74_00705 [Fimbriimonadaceae bacterium]